MKLSALLTGCSVVHTRGDSDSPILGIAWDSRQVAPGFIFIAVRGLKMDGNRFVPDAIKRGAVAIVSALPGDSYPDIAWIQVEDERRAMAEIAANFYGHPASQLQAVGITGTNGKTTTAYLTEGILGAAGFPAAMFGTIEYRGPGFEFQAERTTPEAPELQSMFRRVVDAGWQFAVMEVSSHAIELQRVHGLHFEIAVFTNLTRDHLDFHPSMEAYFLAKKKLFLGLDGVIPRVLVLNADDPYSEELRAIAPDRVLSYGLSSGLDVFPRRVDFERSRNEVHAVFVSPIGDVHANSGLLGKPHLYNMGAAIGAAIGLGMTVEAIERGIASTKAVPGRFEAVDAGQDFHVVVDYAHTDDALTRVLQTARELTTGKLIVVFGCGGDRDRSKRPLMGEAAVRGSDFAYATSDNPRNEDPLAILKDIEVGILRAGGIRGTNYELVPNRRDAIRQALEAASPEDTVMLAGKGHETYQVIGDQSLPFDDRAVAREILNELAH